MSSIDARLADLLHLEEQGLLSWEEIRDRSNELLRIVNERRLDEYRGSVVYRFVEDYDVRQKSREYAEMQRSELREWLSKRQ